MKEPGQEVDAVARRVIGAAIEVHKVLGPGLLEPVYERAMCAELRLQSIGFECQKRMPMTYKGVHLGDGRLDLLVEDSLLVELKAVDDLAPIHTAQVVTYLRMYGLHLGLLINFNVKRLGDGVKRVVCSF